jgi:putative redox protein
VTEGNQRFLRRVTTDDHAWLADEPTDVGGDNLGPDPYEQLLAALGTCTSMTLRMYANRKMWNLTGLRVELTHKRDHGPDCERCEEPDQTIDVIERAIEIEGDLDDAQIARLLEIADRCPVHKTLTGDLRIEST